jgi:hypothetical protein
MPNRSTGAVRAVRPTQSTDPIRTVGFILTANANGTLSLTLSQVLDPAALQQALAQHGIGALVEANTFCTSNPARPDPTSIGVLTTRPPFPPTPGFVPAPSATADGPQVSQPGHPKMVFPPDANIETVINPAAMPAGTERFFDYAPSDNLVFAGLIYTNAHTCSSEPPPLSGPKS